MLAECLGGKVSKADQWEVGWQTINFSNTDQTMKVFQWHRYQFTPPDKAVTIARSHACPHQGFTYEKHVIAFQFHPESTIEWVNERANDPYIPPPTSFVQTKEEMLRDIELQSQMQDWYFKTLDQFCVL